MKNTIEVWSDIACPFCYLGKKRLLRALDETGLRSETEIRWKAFLLNPDQVTDTTISLMDYLAREKGWDREQIGQINSRIMDSGKELDIDFRFDRVVVANTRRAHQILKFAGRAGVADRMSEQLFQAYFTEGRNVDETEVLMELAIRNGLPAHGVADVLETGGFLEEIQADIREAGQLRVTGVPFFVLGRKLAVSGAQPHDVFVQAIKQALF